MGIPLIFLILFSLLVIADNSIYPFLGGDDSDFYQSNTFFNPTTTANVSYQTVSIDDYSYAPLVDDLDGVSPKEIVIIDGSQLFIYQSTGSTITYIDDIDLIGVPFAPPYIYDIDGDGTKEILIARGGSVDNISVFNVSGGVLNLEYDINGDSWDDLVGVLACRDVDDCLISYTSATNDRFVYAVGFNSSNQSAIQTVLDVGTDDVCFPYIRNIAINDFDADGTDEFLISFRETSQSGGDNIYIYQLDTSGSMSVTENSVTKTVTGSIGDPTSSTCVSTNAGQSITSPLILDFKTGGGNELLVGASENPTEYRLYAYDSNLAFEERYPSTFDVEGALISNPILTDTYSISGREDVCLVGYDNINSQIRILCASEKGDVLPLGIDSDEFAFNINVSSISPNDQDLENLVHSIQSISTLTDGHNPDEILTSLGVVSLDLADRDASLIWSNPKGTATIIPVDYFNDARNELFILTDTNFWIANDGFTNTHCNTYNCIRNQSNTNPSIETIIKVNTTFQVQLLIKDFDGDNVAGRVILYDGDTNEQDTGWSVNASSGTTFSFSELKVNKTGTYNILFKARDTDDPSLVQTLTFPFTVANEGSEFGETLFTFGTSAEDESIPSGEGVDDGITALASDLGNASGLSNTTIWLIFMTLAPLVAIGLILSSGGSIGGHHISGLIGIITFVEVLLLIIGVRLNFISTGLLIAVMVIALAIIGVLVARRVFSSN